MSSYKTRHITFKELITVNDWKVKVYTITKTQKFENSEFYNNVLNKLPEWLAMTNSFNANHEHIAFLILHFGTEGIFSIINWWVGENMLNTNIFISDYEEPQTFKKISGDGLAPCIWELEVINHERLSWIKNVLKPNITRNYHKYLNDYINLEL